MGDCVWVAAVDRSHRSDGSGAMTIDVDGGYGGYATGSDGDGRGTCEVAADDGWVDEVVEEEGEEVMVGQETRRCHVKVVGGASGGAVVVGGIVVGVVAAAGIAGVVAVAAAVPGRGCCCWC